MDVAGLVDRAAAARVLVFGSLPPEGRDLDLLARPEERERVEQALRKAGCAHVGTTWVAFSGCSATAIELVPSESWGLPGSELVALYDEAVPVDGYRHLVRPAPHHALLILARTCAPAGNLPPKKRRRVLSATDETPASWDRAEARAPMWGCEAELRWLKRAFASEERMGSRPSIAGVMRAAARLLRPRSAVVAFSGLDGSGKTTQAEALRDTLGRLGIPAVVTWSRLSYNPSLDVIARPFKGVASRRRTSVDVAGAGSDPGKELRKKSRTVTYAWAAVVAVANALTHRKLVMSHLRRGKVVICDRYTLDSAVHLRYRYGRHKRFGLQLWLLRHLSPRPSAAIFLDVAPEVALQRKEEQYDLDQLTRQAELYRRQWEALRYERLDGRIDRDALCEQIARRVWPSITKGNRSP